MKKKNIFLCIGLSSLLAAGVFAGVVAGSRNFAKAEAANERIYFNLSEFGPTYDDSGVTKETSFSVWAYGSGSESDAWIEVHKEGSYSNVFYIDCDDSYATFKVVRAANGVTNTWPNGSTSWNETCAITKSSYNYFWLGNDGGMGQSYGPHTIKSATVDIKNGVRISLYYNFTNFQQANVNVSLEAGKQFKINNGGDLYGYSALEEAAKALFTEEEDDYIGVKSTSLYEIYYKESGAIWAQIDSFTEASTWAEDFVEHVGCLSTYDAKPANWDSFAASFALLTNGGKDLLIGATASNANNATYIQQAAFIHDMCVAKYAGCTVFMAREGGGSRAAFMNPIAKTSTTPVIVISIISIISISAVGAFFIIRRRKHQ